ncbi:MAG: 3-phosphoshikimate 1-carboxyvinyltransferase [Kiloniellales bacterium]|nr:3-phosphoshikimate 1-carboxyvinyltransferase [Kiloniellales bacterium]
MVAITAHPCEGLNGRIRVPGDKSISHRALMLGALAVGETRITGLLEAEDVLATARAVSQLGAELERDEAGQWRVQGRGLGGLVAPEDVLDLGNSGTGARLMMGILASHPLTAVLTGDASLRSRPMARVAAPLQLVGATISAREGCRLPLTLTGSADPLPIRYRLPVASAQVKSAVLLAGLNAPGETTVIEPEPTRDHSERMLRHFGAEVAVEDVVGDGAEIRQIRLSGQPELSAAAVQVPGDPSSAAFPAVAALLLPGAEVTIEGVGLNPLRSGLYETLREMGAEIREEDPRELGGEPVADLVVRASSLSGVTVPAERAPRMIDEYPILAVAAACAEGQTVMEGLGELRVKESDRLASMAAGLTACGVKVEEGSDRLVVQGRGGRIPGGNAAPIATRLDHRIAMSFLVLGLAAEQPVTIDDGTPIDTSFPGFAEMMAGLGARLEETGS